MKNTQKKPRTGYFMRIRSRHPSHSTLRRNTDLKFPVRSVFRLGSTTTEGLSNDFIPVQINTPDAVSTSSNKLRMKEAFSKSKKEIPTAPYYTVKSTDINHVYKGKDKIKIEGLSYPILAKRTVGSRGVGMLKLDDATSLREFLDDYTGNPVYFLEEYFNGAREYRLHVSAIGDNFYSCRKLRKSDTPDDRRWFFNSENCVWVTEYEQEFDSEGNFVKFTNQDKSGFAKPKNWKQIVDAAVAAVRAVGLDIGAVDVRTDTKGEKFIILETNSAPSFGEKTELMYLNYLPKLVKYKMEL